MRMWVWAPKKPALDARERGLPDMFWPLTLVFNVLLVAPKKDGKEGSVNAGEDRVEVGEGGES